MLDRPTLMMRLSFLAERLEKDDPEAFEDLIKVAEGYKERKKTSEQSSSRYCETQRIELGLLTLLHQDLE